MKPSTLGKLLSKYISYPPEESREAALRIANPLVRLSSSRTREQRNDFLEVLESAGKAILESDFAENPFVEHLRRKISELMPRTGIGETYSRDISRHAARAFFSLFPREAESKPWLAGVVPSSPFELDWKSRLRSVLTWPTFPSEGGAAYDETVLHSIIMTTNMGSEKMRSLMELSETLPREQAAKLKRAMFVRAVVELDPSAATEDYFSGPLFSEVKWTPSELFETVRNYLSDKVFNLHEGAETPEDTHAPQMENLFERNSDRFDRAAAVRRLFGEPRFATILSADASETEDMEPRLEVAETLRLGGWSTGVASYDKRYEAYVETVVARATLLGSDIKEDGSFPAL